MLNQKAYLAKLLFTLLLLPLLYLSAVRFISEFVISIDRSSLWENKVLAGKLSTQHSTLNTLAFLDPFNSTYRYLMARNFTFPDRPDKIDLKYADKRIRSALDLSIIEPEYWILHGWLEGKMGHIDNGFRQFERAIALNPGRPGSHMQEALYLDYVGPFVAADKRVLTQQLTELRLNIALGLDPSFIDDPEVSLALAEVYSNNGDRKRTLEMLSRMPPAVVPYQPSRVVRKWHICFKLGDAYTPVSEWNKIVGSGILSMEQMRFFRNEMAIYTEPDFKYMLASIYLQEGKPDLALKELVALVALKKDVAHYRIALGDVYEKLGNYREAKINYDKAVELSPANQDAKKRLIDYYRKH